MLMNKNLFTAKQSEKIISLHKKGKSQRAIAEAIGRSRAGVWGVLSRAGLIKPKAKAVKVAKKPVKKPAKVVKAKATKKR